MLRAFWESHREAEASLQNWVQLVRSAQWHDFAQLRRTFPAADQVTVASGRTVVIFNIAYNRYRLIAAVHYNRKIVYTLKILTHKEYDRNHWKQKL